MKQSPYIAWAKSRHGIRYNLASSGVTACTLADLAPEADDLAVNGPNHHGYAPLVERIAERYGVAPGAVALAHGASMANHLAMAALLHPGDEVLVETPVYEPLHAVPRYLGGEVRFFPRPAEHGYRVDPERVRALLTPRTRLIVLSNLHNPTGALAADDELGALAELAEERDLHVLLDEVYLEWLHDAGHRSAVHLSPRLVATRSLTKAYGLDGLRVGWVLAEPPLAARIRALTDLFSITVAHPSERLAVRALARADHLAARLAPAVTENRQLVDALVERHPALSWSRPLAGTVGLVRVAGMEVNALVERLEREHDATVAPGRFFGAPDAFRIGFGMRTEVLREGLARLEEALGG